MLNTASYPGQLVPQRTLYECPEGGLHHMVCTAQYHIQGVPHDVQFSSGPSSNITERPPSVKLEDVQNTAICPVKLKTTSINTRAGNLREKTGKLKHMRNGAFIYKILNERNCAKLNH